MKYDKLSLFADGLTIPTTANNTTYSKVIDLRKSTFIDPLLKIFGTIVGTVNATGSVTTKVQVSDTGADNSWTDYVSFTQDGMYLIRTVMPIMNKKRFMRLAFVVGSPALGSAVSVKVGFVDQFDMTEIEGCLPATQSYPPLEDLATDAFGENLVLGDPSASATAGTAATIDYAVKKGTVTTIDQCATATVTTTCANGVVEVKTTQATSAGTYTIGLVDGLGAKTTLSVVVASAG